MYEAVGVAAKGRKRSGVVKQGLHIWASVPVSFVMLQNFW
jgi:hypothetical protein